MSTLQYPDNLIELLKMLKEDGIPESDFHIYVDKFLERKARKNYVPLHGHFELTPFCNLDCKMCYVHLDTKQIQRDSLLSADTWKYFIKQAHEMGMIKASLTGGECLTYPGFEEVYEYLFKLGIKVNVLTNGVLLDERKVALFKKLPPKFIQISLYGSSNRSYKLVTGKEVFDTVRRNINLAKDAGLPIGLVITPNQFMYNNYKELLTLAHSFGIPYNINGSLIKPRDNTGRQIKDLSPEQYVELYEFKRFLDKQVIQEVLEDLPDENKDAMESVHGIKCAAGRSSFCVSWDGKLGACSSLPDIIESGLDTSFADAWKKINKKVDEYLIPCECEKCVYSSSCIQCVAVHNAYNFPGHCNPEICERTKLLIKKGFLSLPID